MKTLLSKYRKGKITPEEFDLLAEKAEAASDAEIARVLEKEWMEEGGQSRTKRLPLWLGIAAGLALLVAAGLGIRMADTAATSGRLASREVRIDAGNDDRSRVVLPDGTKVTLSPKSQLRYSAAFGQADRNVELVGQGYFDVAKDPHSKFTVCAQGMEITVHGTKFNVYANPDNGMKEVSLIEGSISLRYGDSEMNLSPNEKVIISGNTGRMNRMRTDNAVETAWLEDRMVFINKPLYQVIDILQRHFMVNIECSGNINLTDRYTGTFTEHRIREVLDILRMHYGFTYEIRDDRIVIHK